MLVLDLQVSLRGKVDLPPDEVFDILVAEDNHKVFKSIKARRLRPNGACSCALRLQLLQLRSPVWARRWQAVAYRKVLRDDGNGRLDAEVEQIGQWKFLCFSGSFATRLYVYQDKRRGTVGPALHCALYLSLCRAELRVPACCRSTSSWRGPA